MSIGKSIAYSMFAICPICPLEKALRSLPFPVFQQLVARGLAIRATGFLLPYFLLPVLEIRRMVKRYPQHLLCFIGNPGRVSGTPATNPVNFPRS